MLLDRTRLTEPLRRAAAESEILVNPDGAALDAARALRTCAYAMPRTPAEAEVERFFDRFDGAPNTLILAIRRHGAMIGSLRMSVCDAVPGTVPEGDGPVAWLCGDGLGREPLSGRIVDHSRFSIDRTALDAAGAHLLLFAAAYVAARGLGGTVAAGAVFPHHTRFWESMFGFRRDGAPRHAGLLPMPLQLVQRSYGDIAAQGFDEAALIGDLRGRWRASFGDGAGPDDLRDLSGTV